MDILQWSLNRSEDHDDFLPVIQGPMSKEANEHDVISNGIRDKCNQAHNLINLAGTNELRQYISFKTYKRTF